MGLWRDEVAVLFVRQVTAQALPYAKPSLKRPACCIIVITVTKSQAAQIKPITRITPTSCISTARWRCWCPDCSKAPRPSANCSPTATPASEPAKARRRAHHPRRRRYKVGQSGVAERVPDDFTMPFANVHHAAFQYQCERRDIGLEDLNNRIVEANGRANTFFSVIVRGTFSFIKTRAVIKQQAPYPTLVEVADRQAMFLRHDVKGTMLGYFSPEMFHGAAVAGFHEHFLSDDRTFGGHVLDAVLDHGKIYSQVFDTLVQHLPVDDPEYRNHDFRHDPIAEAITAAEGDKAGN